MMIAFRYKVMLGIYMEYQEVVSSTFFFLPLFFHLIITNYLFRTVLWLVFSLFKKLTDLFVSWYFIAERENINTNA